MERDPKIYSPHEGFTPKRALIDKLNDALELVEQIAHPLANKRGNVGNSSTCNIVKMASLFSLVLVVLTEAKTGYFSQVSVFSGHN